MKLNRQELEFLSAWAREEKAADPFSLPAHRLQAAHKIPGVTLIRAIKSWARTEGCTDEEIFDLYENSTPSWPWSSEKEMAERLTGVCSGMPLTGDPAPSPPVATSIAPPERRPR